ncbi:hypothetical protein [Roseivirga sp.]|uniref:hypothetical protein n=1 Tax=Roseivirga sp. TaxID=1964215 RepID=UPI002B270EF7|nr:hypothetical protein [Roseivirga sp.]
MKKIFTAPKIIGTLLLVINIYWLYLFADLYYLYHFTNARFPYMIPDYVLFIHIVISIIGIYLGTKVFLKKLPPFRWAAIDILLIAMGLVLENFIMN